MSTTLIAGNFADTVLLRIGERITITTAATSSARIDRKLGDTVLETVTLGASATHVFGGYPLDLHIAISSLTGSLTYTSSVDTSRDLSEATQTNDDAAAGEIGEYKETTVLIGSIVSETTNTPVDVATLALTPGDWEVSGTVSRVLTGTTATQYAVAISPTANTVPGQAAGSGVAADSSVTQNATFGATVTGNYVSLVGPVRVKLAAAATMHLVAADLFSAGTIGLFGTIRARRVR